jgi:transitional endoplasmic reticulum ATPase
LEGEPPGSSGGEFGGRACAESFLFRLASDGDMEAWPTAAAVPAKATEYWPSQQSTCSWLNSWAGTEGANAEPAAKRTATEGGTEQRAPDVKGKESGGAKSFNRFGTKDPQAAENAVRQLRKLGVAVKVTLADVGGADHALQQLRENIELPMRKPKVFSTLGVAPPIGSLMYGPSGCGKTLIARALGNELNLHVVTVDAPALVTDLLGESELVLRAAFAEAEKNQPALVFIEQLDAVAPKRGRDSGSSVESRIVSTLLSCMDEVHAGWMPPRSPKDDGDGGAPWAPKRVCVLAATRSINSIDTALRRAGRFEREICVRCPDAAGRLEMLQVMTRDMCLDGEVDLAVVADEAQGYVGADLAALCRHAGLACIREAISKDKNGGAGLGWDAQKVEALKSASVLQREASMASLDDPSTAASLAVAQRHFTEAAYRIACPSALREHIGSGDRGTGPSSRLKWADVGGIDAQRRDVEELVSYPLLHHDKFKRLGVRPPKGVLMYGPPGVGKTLLARVVASECNCNLITVNGPELLSPYVGQSEARLRELFAAARQSAPCVLFLDEIDAMAQVEENSQFC